MHNSNSAEIIAEINIDSVDELPKETINEKTLHQGSTALIIKDGRIAVLAGDRK